MTYFDYLKHNNYKTLTKEIKLENNIDNYTFTYTFNPPINLISIKIPEILDKCILNIIGGENNTDLYFVTNLNLCMIEFFNNYNFYQKNVKKIMLIVNNKEIIEYLNIHKIKIEHSFDKILNETITCYSFYINIKLKYIKELFLCSKNMYNDIFNTFKLLKKEINDNNSSYLYKINLDIFKNLDGDTHINNYIKNNYHHHLDIKYMIFTLYND